MGYSYLPLVKYAGKSKFLRNFYEGPYHPYY